MKQHLLHIPAGTFKSQCLQLMDQVKLTHKSIVITKHGKPVAKLTPIESKPLELFGQLKDSISIQGDIIAAIDEEWDAEKYKL